MNLFHRTRKQPVPEPSPVVEAAQRLSQLAKDLQRGSSALMQMIEMDRPGPPAPLGGQ